MEIRKHQLLNYTLPDHVLDKPLDPPYIPQHVFIRLSNLRLPISMFGSSRSPIGGVFSFLLWSPH